MRGKSSCRKHNIPDSHPNSTKPRQENNMNVNGYKNAVDTQKQINIYQGKDGSVFKLLYQCLKKTQKYGILDLSCCHGYGNPEAIYSAYKFLHQRLKITQKQVNFDLSCYHRFENPEAIKSVFKFLYQLLKKT